jgi:hypothetical protein
MSEFKQTEANGKRLRGGNHEHTDEYGNRDKRYKFGKKRCGHCRILQRTVCFNSNISRKDNLMRFCRECAYLSNKCSIYKKNGNLELLADVREKYDKIHTDGLVKEKEEFISEYPVVGELNYENSKICAYCHTQKHTDKFPKRGDNYCKACACVVEHKRNYKNLDTYIKYLHTHAIVNAKQRLKVKNPIKARGEVCDDLSSILSKKIDKPCHYSGFKLTRVLGSIYNASPERLDNDKGYVEGNVELVCVCFNTIFETCRWSPVKFQWFQSHSTKELSEDIIQPTLLDHGFKIACQKLSKTCISSSAKRQKKRSTEDHSSVLTRTDIMEMYAQQKGVCGYSGVIMDWRKNAPHWKMSIERKDRTVGYSKENSILICLEFNTLMVQLSSDIVQSWKITSKQSCECD